MAVENKMDTAPLGELTTMELERLRAQVALLQEQLQKASAPAVVPDGPKFRVRFGAVGGYEFDHNGKPKDRDYLLGEIVTERQLGGPDKAVWHFRLGAIERIKE